jgi:beta-lactam-binding protein with PASTA domain
LVVGLLVVTGAIAGGASQAGSGKTDSTLALLTATSTTSSIAGSTTTTTYPSGSTGGTSEELVQVPNILSMLEAEAEAALAAVGLQCDVSSYWTTISAHWGYVRTQTLFGTWVPVGTAVKIGVGAEGVAVPDVVGMANASWELDMALSDFAPVKTYEFTLNSADWDYVIAQDPPSGLVVEPGSIVTLTIGEKRTPLTLPTLPPITTTTSQPHVSLPPFTLP